jgi:hypothetical protein
VGTITRIITTGIVS